MNCFKQLPNLICVYLLRKRKFIVTTYCLNLRYFEGSSTYFYFHITPLSFVAVTGCENVLSFLCVTPVPTASPAPNRACKSLLSVMDLQGVLGPHRGLMVDNILIGLVIFWTITSKLSTLHSGQQQNYCEW